MIYIILPTHKRTESTKKFLQRLSLNLHEKYLVLIIDDDADQESTHAFKDYENVIIIKGDGNLWWGGAINAGINYLTKTLEPDPSDICIFANNDVEISKTSYKPLAELLYTKKGALYHPRVMNRQGRYISAGARILCWFPYISYHPKRFPALYKKIDLATARFLCFRIDTLQKIGYISRDLPHYGGDNYFSLKAKQLGFPTYLVRDAVCYLDESKTGLNIRRIKSIKELWHSFFTIRSANNLLFRYRFLNGYFHNPLFSLGVLISMLFNIIMKFLLKKLFRKFSI
jgi:GT2 family glycosyltransferase